MATPSDITHESDRTGRAIYRRNDVVTDCVGGAAGERLLIVSEPPGSGFYDEAAPRITAAAARALNMRVYQTQSDCFLASAADTDTLMETLRGFDHIVFFSRVGIRFDSPMTAICPLPPCATH